MFSCCAASSSSAAFRLRFVHFLKLVLSAGYLLWWAAPARANSLVTNLFYNTVDLYDDQTGQLIQQGFFAPSVNPGDPQFLTDVIVDPVNHRGYVSANGPDISDKTRIYYFDAATGAALPSPSGGADGVFLEWEADTFSPAGLALDAAGNLYVANQGGLNVDKYDTTGTLVNSYGDGGTSIQKPSGLAFGPDGDLFVSNFDSGMTVKINTTTGDIFLAASPGINGPFHPNGVLVGPGGEFYVADVFGNHVFKYGPDGVEITGPSGESFITIDLPNIPPEATHPNAPSGLDWDEDGNLLVAVLGPTNPFTPPYEVHGALLRFSAGDGSLLQALAYGLPPASSVARIPTVPSADFDHDEDVDGNDFLIWQAALGVDDSGDANIDGDTDGNDLLIWKNQFGHGPSQSLNSVPEPATWLMLLLTFAGIRCMR
ncbi:MAG: hypothetical protein JW829_04830 [Pirellulales bacterium]|nr:hypothetical protein [Pirellulales bacterium]